MCLQRHTNPEEGLPAADGDGSATSRPYPFERVPWGRAPSWRFVWDPVHQIFNFASCVESCWQVYIYVQALLSPGSVSWDFSTPAQCSLLAFDSHGRSTRCMGSLLGLQHLCEANSVAWS